MDFVKRCEEHAGLESFDPQAFVPDELASKDVCSFVLTLAVIFNDSKDIGFGVELLDEARPNGASNHSRIWGNFCALEQHLYRSFFGLLHELFQLMQTNQGVLEDKFFVSIISKMSKETRENWKQLVEVTQGATPKTPLGHSLLLARNKVAFHYDAVQILRGFQEHFVGDERIDERAFVSRGRNMRRSRFYFADAAIQSYMQKVASGGKWGDLLDRSHGVFNDLNQAVMEIVVGFIQIRAGSFRVERDEVA